MGRVWFLLIGATSLLGLAVLAWRKRGRRVLWTVGLAVVCALTLPRAFRPSYVSKADGTWNVAGSVGHWGHVHQRQQNQYQARFVVNAVDGLWKITDLELLQEERLPS